MSRLSIAILCGRPSSIPESVLSELCAAVEARLMARSEDAPIRLPSWLDEA